MMEHGIAQLSEIRRNEIITWYLRGKTSAELARRLRVSPSTVSAVITDAINRGEINSDLKLYAPASDIEPHDYTGASEYTLHFKGAEFEDTRCKELRDLGALHPFRYRI